MIISSDSHYDTKSEIDRNEDIHNKQLEIIQYVIRTKQDYYVNMGDIFDNENPKADMIAKVVQWIIMLEENKIKSFIMLGNHDGKNLVHSLTFIKEMNLKYVEVIDNPGWNTLPIKGTDKKVKFIFIPHINKQLVIKRNAKSIKKLANDKENRKIINKLKDVDFFIDVFAQDVIKNLQPDELNLAFGHLNIDDAVIGPDDINFKSNKVNFPKRLRECSKIKYIFNGHIHKFQIIESMKVPVIIPGSIETRRFDERNDDRFFVEVDLKKLVGE